MSRAPRTAPAGVSVMQHLIIRVVLVAALGIGVALPAMAQDTSGATARVLSSSMVDSIKVGADAADAEGGSDPGVTACVRAIPPSALEPMYSRLLDSEFTASERAVLDAFHGSEAGALLFRDIHNDVRHAGGLPVTDPVELSPAHRAEIAAFEATPEARKLARMTGASNGVVSKALGVEVDALLMACF